jgi:hypothetical protein
MVRIMDEVPLYSIESKEKQLQILHESLAETDYDPSDLIVFDSEMFQTFFRRHLSAYTKGIDLNSKSIPELEEIYQTFKQKYPERLYLTIEKIFQQFSRELLMLPFRGERWVLSSLLQVNTLISDIPVDPVEAKKAKIAFLQEEIDSSTASMIVDAEFDMMQSGSV